MSQPNIKKIVVVKEKCIGCASCTVFAPKAFALGNDGKAMVIVDPLDLTDPKDIEAVISAAKACPMVSIELYDENGAKISL